MDIISLYKDFGIDYRTEGHKHCKPGWVNIKCPFCEGNPGFHLGFNIRKAYFNCRRCGSKSVPYVLKNLLKADYNSDIFSVYGYIGAEKPEIEEEPVKKLPFKLPAGTTNLLDIHKEYLIGRGFCPDKLARDWHLKGTGPVAMLGSADYSNRIIIPITWNGEVVSFQGRDITGKSKLKYKACTQKRELVDHQHILYGREEFWDKDCGICVEGVVDVWKMGFKAFAVYGISFTAFQVREIARLFRTVIVIFDGETRAQQQADKLISELRFRGVVADKILIEGDPGEKKPEEITEIHKLIKAKLEELKCNM